MGMNAAAADHLASIVEWDPHKRTTGVRSGTDRIHLAGRKALRAQYTPQQNAAPRPTPSMGAQRGDRRLSAAKTTTCAGVNICWIRSEQTFICWLHATMTIVSYLPAWRRACHLHLSAHKPALLRLSPCTHAPPALLPVGTYLRCLISRHACDAAWAPDASDERHLFAASHGRTGKFLARKTFPTPAAARTWF